MRILLDKLGDVRATYFCDDETHYYFYHVEKTGTTLYGQNTVSTNGSESCRLSKTLPREEILLAAATRFLIMFPHKYDYAESEYKRKLEEWETGRKLLVEYGGDLNKYERIKPKKLDKIEETIKFFERYIK